MKNSFDRLLNSRSNNSKKRFVLPVIVLIISFLVVLATITFNLIFLSWDKEAQANFLLNGQIFWIVLPIVFTAIIMWFFTLCHAILSRERQKSVMRWICAIIFFQIVAVIYYWILEIIHLKGNKGYKGDRRAY
jgi:hypothetical protein